MVKKIIKAILTKPLVILKSIYYRITNRNNRLAKYRLAICNKCVDKRHSKFGDICGQCGCILDNKVRIENEKCVNELWDN
jgi:hypothetical protein